jgi:hypothetical protein
MVDIDNNKARGDRTNEPIEVGRDPNSTVEKKSVSSVYCMRLYCVKNDDIGEMVSYKTVSQREPVREALIHKLSMMCSNYSIRN